MQHSVNVDEVRRPDHELGEEASPARREARSRSDHEASAPFIELTEHEGPAEVDRADRLHHMSGRVEDERMRRVDLCDREEDGPVGAIGDPVAGLELLQLRPNMRSASLTDPNVRRSRAYGVYQPAR